LDGHLLKDLAYDLVVKYRSFVNLQLTHLSRVDVRVLNDMEFCQLDVAPIEIFWAFWFPVALNKFLEQISVGRRREHA